LILGQRKEYLVTQNEK